MADIWHSAGMLRSKSLIMLPDAKIHLLLAHQIPGLRTEAETSGAPTKVIQSFTAYTRRMIRAGELPEIRKCFSMAGVLYRNGSRVIREAIESVFLYGLSPLLNAPVKSLLPASLQTLRRQFIVNSSPC